MAVVERTPGPGRIAYLIAFAPLVIGLVAMLAIILTNVGKLGDRLEQIVVPGERVLALEPGVHTVFLETRSVVDGLVYAVNYVPGVSVEVVGTDGTPVDVVVLGGTSNYRMGSREGYSIGRFQIEKAGAYRVSGGYSEGDGPATVIAVAQGFMRAALLMALAAVAAFLGGAVASGVGVVLVAVLRRRAGLPII